MVGGWVSGLWLLAHREVGEILQSFFYSLEMLNVLEKKLQDVPSFGGLPLNPSTPRVVYLYNLQIKVRTFLSVQWGTFDFIKG